MQRTSRPLLSALTLGGLFLSGAAQAGGAGAPPVTRPMAPAAQPARPATTTPAKAQDGRALLDKAFQANGGQALRNLRTMQQRSELTFLDAKGQPALVLQGKASVNYANGWVRITTLQGEQVINEQFGTPEGHFA